MEEFARSRSRHYFVAYEIQACTRRSFIRGCADKYVLDVIARKNTDDANKLTEQSVRALVRSSERAKLLSFTSQFSRRLSRDRENLIVDLTFNCKLR